MPKKPSIYLFAESIIRVMDDLNVRDYKFKNVKNFRYLGSQINGENIMREEILERMGVGSRALFSLGTIFRSRELSITAKIKVWNSIIRPTGIWLRDMELDDQGYAETSSIRKPSTQNHLGHHI